MAKKPKTRSWVVEIRVTRLVEVVCEDCTEAQAREKPWDYAVGSEREFDQEDWEVRSVVPNE
jgi:hypothetical protein